MRKKLYNNLIEKGLTAEQLGTQEAFNKSLDVEGGAETLYGNLQNVDGITNEEIGSKEYFINALSKSSNQENTSEEGPTGSSNQEKSEVEMETLRTASGVEYLVPVRGGSGGNKTEKDVTPEDLGFRKQFRVNRLKGVIKSDKGSGEIISSNRFQNALRRVKKIDLLLDNRESETFETQTAQEIGSGVPPKRVSLGLQEGANLKSEKAQLMEFITPVLGQNNLNIEEVSGEEGGTVVQALLDGSEDLEDIPAERLKTTIEESNSTLSRHLSGDNKTLYEINNRLAELDEQPIQDTREEVTTLQRQRDALLIGRKSFLSDEKRDVEVNSLIQEKKPILDRIFKSLPSDFSEEDRLALYTMLLNTKYQELDSESIVYNNLNLGPGLTGETLRMLASSFLSNTNLDKKGILREELKNLAPVVLLGLTPEYRESLIKRVLVSFGNMSPADYKGELREDQIADLYRAADDAGVIISKEAAEHLDERGQTKLGDRIASTLGGSLGFASDILVTRGMGAPLKIAKLTKLEKIASANRFNKFFVNTVRTGVQYEVAGQLFPNSQEELNFSSGLFGALGETLVKNTFGKVLVGVLGQAGTRQFVKQTQNFLGYGLGELGEETFQTFDQIAQETLGQNLIGAFTEAWRGTERGKKFSSAIEKQFPDNTSKIEFILMSATMGGITQLGANYRKEILGEAQEAYNGLSEKEKDFVDAKEQELLSMVDEASAEAEKESSKDDVDVEDTDTDGAEDAEVVEDADTEVVEVVDDADVVEDADADGADTDGVEVVDDADVVEDADADGADVVEDVEVAKENDDYSIKPDDSEQDLEGTVKTEGEFKEKATLLEAETEEETLTGGDKLTIAKPVSGTEKLSVVSNKKGEVIAHFNTFEETAVDGSVEIASKVEKKSRGKGIATQVYQILANTIGKPILPASISRDHGDTGSTFSKGASEFWRKARKSGLATAVEVTTKAGDIIQTLAILPQGFTNTETIKASQKTPQKGKTIRDVLRGGIETPITLDGEEGVLRRDKITPNRVVFETESQIIEFGSIGDLQDTEISELGLALGEKVNISSAGVIEVRGKEYTNQNKNPLSAITNTKGREKSVTLLNNKGGKVTFKGQIAQDIAYQITQKNVLDENAEAFTEFVEKLNNDEEIFSLATEEAGRNIRAVSEGEIKEGFSYEVKGKRLEIAPAQEGDSDAVVRIRKTGSKGVGSVRNKARLGKTLTGEETFKRVVKKETSSSTETKPKSKTKKSKTKPKTNKTSKAEDQKQDIGDLVKKATTESSGETSKAKSDKSTKKKDKTKSQLLNKAKELGVKVQKPSEVIVQGNTVLRRNLARLVNIAKALVSVSPNLRVIVAETQEIYEQLTGSSTSSAAIAGDILVINSSFPSLKSNVTFHEAIHPLVNIIKELNEKLFVDLTFDITSAISANPELTLQFTEFINQYSASASEVELVVEFLAAVADGKIKLSSKEGGRLLYTIKKVLQTLLAKLGVNVKGIPLAVSKDLFITANYISVMLNTGLEIQSGALVDTNKMLHTLNSVIKGRKIPKFESVSEGDFKGDSKIEFSKAANPKNNFIKNINKSEALKDNFTTKIQELGAEKVLKALSDGGIELTYEELIDILGVPENIAPKSFEEVLDAVQDEGLLGGVTNKLVNEFLANSGVAQLDPASKLSYTATVKAAHAMGLYSANLDTEKAIALKALSGEGINEFEATAIHRALDNLASSIESLNEMIVVSKGKQLSYLIVQIKDKESLLNIFAQANKRAGTTAARLLIHRRLAKLELFSPTKYKDAVDDLNIAKKDKIILKKKVDEFTQKKEELKKAQELQELAAEKIKMAEAKESISQVLKSKDTSARKKFSVLVKFKNFFSGKGFKYSHTSGEGFDNSFYKTIFDRAKVLIKDNKITNIEILIKQILADYKGVKSKTSTQLNRDHIIHALALGNQKQTLRQKGLFVKALADQKSIEVKQSKLVVLLKDITKLGRKPSSKELKVVIDLINNMNEMYLTNDYMMSPAQVSNITQSYNKVRIMLQKAYFNGKKPTPGALSAIVLASYKSQTITKVVISELENKLKRLGEGAMPFYLPHRQPGKIDARVNKLNNTIRRLRNDLEGEYRIAEELSELKTKYPGTIPFLGEISKMVFNAKSVFTGRNIYEFSRRYVFGSDISVVMMQGGIQAMSTLGRVINPIGYLTKYGRSKTQLSTKGLIQSYKGMLQTFYSGIRNNPDTALDIYEELLSTPQGVYFHAQGLTITRPFQGSSSNTEEYFNGLGLGDIRGDSPASVMMQQVFGRIDNMSEGSYTTMLNVLRFHMASAFMTNHPNATQDEVKRYMAYVNENTGRGNVKTTGGLSILFAAPRLYLSRIKIIGKIPAALAKLVVDPNDIVSREIVSDGASFLMGQVAIGFALKLLGWEFQDDPRDKEFLKYKKGDETLDVTAGLGKWIKLLVKSGLYVDEKVLGRNDIIKIYGDRKKSQETNALTEKPDALLMQLAKYSLHPTMSNGLTITTGQNIIGQPVGTTGKELAWNYFVGSFTPLGTQDLMMSDSRLDDKRSSLDKLVDLAITTSLSEVGVNHTDYENSIMNLDVVKHLDAIEFNPAHSFTNKHIDKIFPSLAKTDEKLDTALNRNKRLKFKSEVFNAAGGRVLEALRAGTPPAIDQVKEFLVEEGDRIAILYSDYYDLEIKEQPPTKRKKKKRKKKRKKKKKI